MAVATIKMKKLLTWSTTGHSTGHKLRRPLVGATTHSTFSILDINSWQKDRKNPHALNRSKVQLVCKSDQNCKS